MFLSTYVITLKNLIRSKTFWLMLCVLLVISVHGALNGYYGRADLDKEYVLSVNKYVQTISNAGCSTLLMYAFPIFAIISTALIITRDYADDFFEIEKSRGVKTAYYLFGRLIALISVNFVIFIFMHLLIMNINVFTRGGVENWDIVAFIIDSFVRVLRFDFFVALPTLIFYIGITYSLGTIFKNSIVPTFISFGYVIFFYVVYLLYRNTFSETYFSYFSPMPFNLRRYFHLYDTEWFEDYVIRNDLSIEKVMFCIAFLVGVSILFSAISYLRLKKRNT